MRSGASWTFRGPHTAGFLVGAGLNLGPSSLTLQPHPLLFFFFLSHPSLCYFCLQNYNQPSLRILNDFCQVADMHIEYYILCSQSHPSLVRGQFSKATEL